MNNDYGYEECPLENSLPCMDFDRLGTIACGLCGASNELTEEGQKNFFEGLIRNIKETKKQ